MRPLWILKDADVALQTGDGSETVLRRLNVRIGEGEFVAVVGRNGSGKSTLLRVLGGFAPIAAGEMAVRPGDDSPVRMVFQSPDAQIVGETVYEDVCFGLENQAVPPDAMPELARSALASVGLNVPADKPVEHLSGGQKQLLCLAGAIVTGARALLLDEPTSMLDPEAREAVLRVVRRLHASGVTVVWTTQAMDEVGAAERVIALDAGAVTFDGTPEAFFYGDDDSTGTDGSPCVSLGLRLPYAVEVAQRLLRSGIAMRDRPVSGGQLLEAVAKRCR